MMGNLTGGPHAFPEASVRESTDVIVGRVCRDAGQAVAERIWMIGDRTLRITSANSMVPRLHGEPLHPPDRAPSPRI
jgi:hypothetical protein